MRVRHIPRRCGGSLAQCHLVHLTGRWGSIACAQRNLARAVVAECTAQKPTSRLNRRLQRRLPYTMPRAIGPMRHLRAHGSMTSGRERMFSPKDCLPSWLDRSTDGFVDNRSGVGAIMKSVPADAGWLASCVPIKSKRCDIGMFVPVLERQARAGVRSIPHKKAPPIASRPRLWNSVDSPSVR
jgi:hypothetical protein